MIQDMDKKDYNTIREWIRKNKHLPTFMRDFHDQKDLFKTMGGLETKPPYPEITWMTVHISTIDKFLWWMAFHGYTMQKCRANQPFQDLHEAKEDRREKESEMFRKVLEQGKKESSKNGND